MYKMAQNEHPPHGFVHVHRHHRSTCASKLGAKLVISLVFSFALSTRLPYFPLADARFNFASSRLDDALFGQVLSSTVQDQQRGDIGTVPCPHSLPHYPKRCDRFVSLSRPIGWSLREEAAGTGRT